MLNKKTPAPHCRALPPMPVLASSLLACALVLLAGCSGGSAPGPDPDSPQGVVEARDAAASAETGPGDVPGSANPNAPEAAARGEQALREQRLFQPVSDNAFEWFLAAVEADPADERSRLALQDLVPYAILHVEQRLAASDPDEAERVLAILVRAAPEAPALPRLQSGLDELRQRQSDAQRAAEAAARVAAQPRTPQPAAPAPVAPAPSRPTLPETPAQAAALAEPPETAAAAPASATRVPPAAVAATAAPRVPEVLFRPALRYPPMAERRRLEGSVEIEFTIAADGSVTELEVLRSQPEGIFDREALAAMQRWRFAPPDAPMRARRTLEFKLAQ